MTSPLAHRRARMGGRDPHEVGRVATPLELLFDLTFVVAYGMAADELAHYLAEGHVKTALVMSKLGVTREEAQRRLHDAGGVLTRVVGELDI